MRLTLCLVPQRTDGHVSPGPEEAEREDKGARTLPPQILLPLEERVTHFRDMLLERGVSTGAGAALGARNRVASPRHGDHFQEAPVCVKSPAGARPAFGVRPSHRDTPGFLTQVGSPRLWVRWTVFRFQDFFIAVGYSSHVNLMGENTL